MNIAMFSLNWIVMACFIYANIGKGTKFAEMKCLGCKAVFLGTKDGRYKGG